MPKYTTLIFFILLTLGSVAQETGYASYYADYMHGRKTANGDHYHKDKYTAAHKTLPMGTHVKVTNLNNNKSVIVTINDRGPYISGRVLDLSMAAARALDFVASGYTRIRYEVVDTNFQSVPDSIPAMASESKLFEVNEIDSTAKKGFGIKFGSFENLVYAMDEASQLKTKYQISTFIQIAKLSAGTFYRVYAGSFSSKETAETFKNNLDRTYQGCMVVAYKELK